MKSRYLLMLLFFPLVALQSTASAQDRNCPYFSGSVKKRVEKQARWLVSESLKKQVAERSIPFGRLVEFGQCHALESRLLSEGDIMVEGPFFVAEGVPVKSLIGRSQGTWTMAVVPSEATSRMPNPNLLEIPAHTWTLSYRDERKNTRLVATGKY